MKELPQEGFVRMKQITHALGMSSASIYNRINVGRFPAPQKDGRMSLWPVEVVRKYIKENGGSVRPEADPDSQPTPAS